MQPKRTPVAIKDRTTVLVYDLLFLKGVFDQFGIEVQQPGNFLERKPIFGIKVHYCFCLFLFLFQIGFLDVKTISKLNLNMLMNNYTFAPFKN